MLNRSNINEHDALNQHFLKQQIAEIRSKMEPYLDALQGHTLLHLLCHMWIHLLATVPAGYDARFRYGIKTFVVVFYLMQNAKGEEALEDATRYFQALEHCIAQYLLLFLEQQQKKQDSLQAKEKVESSKLMRNLKIGGAAVAAGGLFAITGGLAGPGIAAGIAAVAGGTAIGATAAALFASSTIVTALFGIGGGTLAAYKMRRRTDGLTEFEIQSEARDESNKQSYLSSTVAISGWLLEDYDFQRPWGVAPSNPKISDRLEILERFYSVYCPEQLPHAKRHLEVFKGQEEELWKLLTTTYGRNPDSPFPRPGHSTIVKPSSEQVQIVRETFAGIGLVNLNEIPKESSETQEGVESASFPIHITSNEEVKEFKPPKHLSTVWDYHETYGGELNTVKFESRPLKDLCDAAGRAVSTMIKSEGTKQALKYTVMATLLTAVALPSLLLKVANMIDGDWTMICERADEAGVELARALLYHKGGNRPVTLVGYSFGARIIYSCARELVRYQKLWEGWQEKQKGSKQEKSEHDEQDSSNEVDFASIRDPSSILEDVTMMGLPKAFRPAEWESIRSVVAGRLINCFSQKDLMLGLMFRYKRLNVQGVCGTAPVSLTGVEDVDVSDLVSGHSEYCYSINGILQRVRFGQPFCSASTKFEEIEDEMLSSGVETNISDEKNCQ